MGCESPIKDAERIGTIGSPSSTAELSLDIMGTAVDKKLVGELVFFEFRQDGKLHYAIGQITEVQLRNVWLEDPTMRSLARHRGVVNPVSGQQDTHVARMNVGAVFAFDGSKFEPSILGTVPPTGTFIKLATDSVLERILEGYREEIFYLGRVYGSTPKLPMWFKHFSSGPNGAGEAYHIGIFGKTGSGKSVLAKMIILAYAKHPDMAVFVMDPQGEFSKDATGRPGGGFPLNLKELFSQLGREVIVKGIKDIVLDRWELFEEILYESPFFERLAVRKGDNRRIACELLKEELRKARVKLEDLYREESFKKAWSVLNSSDIQEIIYKTREYRDNFARALGAVGKNLEAFYHGYWKPVAELFRKDRPGAISVDGLIRKVFGTSEDTLFGRKRPIVIIDLSKESASGMFWNETIQSIVIKRLLDGLRASAESAYRDNRSLNTLVVLDEAHRLAPRERIDNEKLESVRASLLDAVRTTRKYGLGWMFISQTLSSLHREIITQLRIFFFGFGLSLGTEFQALKEIVGGDPNALKLYQSFRDPHSSFDLSSREYSFMTVGPVSPLSFAGSPLFFTAFNTPEEFLSVNGFRVQKSA